MRKLIVLTAVAALTVGSVASVSAQDRWAGGDDLPTNPLGCGPDAPPPEAPAEVPAYDGGQPTNPPDKAGQPITLVDIPKLIGIGYFNATAAGMQEAAAELGNVEVINDGPTAANIDEQIQFLDQAITQGANGLLFAANDPVAIGPVLQKALEILQQYSGTQFDPAIVEVFLRLVHHNPSALPGSVADQLQSLDRAVSSGKAEQTQDENAPADMWRE